MRTMIWRSNDEKSSRSLYDYLNFLKDKDQKKQIDYVITIKKNRPVRSISQNSYYWICLQAIAAETGDTTDQLHEWYKLEFLSQEFRGKIIGKSTTELDSGEFTIYLNKVKTHAREFHNVYISDPADRNYAVWEQVTKEKYNSMFSSI